MPNSHINDWSFFVCLSVWLINNKLLFLIVLKVEFSSVQSLSFVWLFATPWSAARVFPVLHQLPDVAQTHVQPKPGGRGLQLLNPLKLWVSSEAQFSFSAASSGTGRCLHSLSHPGLPQRVRPGTHSARCAWSGPRLSRACGAAVVGAAPTKLRR